MSIYHTIMEVFNIIHNKSSEQISNKYSHHGRHSLRKNTNNFIRVPELHEHRNCTGFTYCGAKIFNSLPIKTRETQDRNSFKTLVKKWIWDEVPSYWKTWLHQKNNQTIVYIIFIFISLFFITIKFLTKPLRVLEDKVK